MWLTSGDFGIWIAEEPSNKYYSMCIWVRIWDGNRITSRFFNIKFMGHTAALDVLKVFQCTLKDVLGYRN